MQDTMRRRLNLRLKLAALACGAYGSMFSAADAMPHQVYDDTVVAVSDTNDRPTAAHPSAAHPSARPASAAPAHKVAAAKTEKAEKGTAHATTAPRDKHADAAKIERAQTALANAGQYAGKIDGVLNPVTTEAIVSFQKAHKLRPTGKLDALTLRKLGVAKG